MLGCITIKNLFINIITCLIVTFIINLYFFRVDSKDFIKKIIENNTSIKIIDNSNCINDFDIIINNDSFYNKVMTLGEVGLGESYMDGDWDSKNLETTLLLLNNSKNKILNEIKKNSLYLIILYIKASFKALLPNNTLITSKKNISSHYDVGNDLYEKMLDKNMQYTCAYYYKDDLTLDEAQEAKLNLIAKKLNFQEGDRVLDIGCGFGSASSYFAKNYRVKVLGVTLSKEQINYYKDKFDISNVEIRYQDYREVTGKFDKIYSIGMFEHVGKKNYKEYYDKCYDLLEDNGIMLLHTICTTERNFNSNTTWANKYIFPEGELPHISNFTEKQSDKWFLQDYQNFGLSYAKTLRAWHNNIGNWTDLDKYDNKFKRMWKFYLMGASSCFQSRIIYLSQLVYFKNTTTRKTDAYFIRENQ